MERRVFAAIVILLGYNTALAALPDAVANAMARHRLDPSHLSVAVRPVDGGPALAAHNAAVLRNPASTIKVLTTFAALHQLGPTYTWETHALVAGGLRNGQLAGPLILRGEGDPFLVTEQLYKLLLQVRVRGVREIQGGLILDDSYFRLPEGDPGAFDGNAHRPYNVLPGALVVNFQTTRLTLVPQDGGRRGLILADPPASNLTVVDNLTWTEGHCRGKRLHVTIDHEDRGGRVVVGGRYPRACGEDEIYRSVATASAMTFGVVDALWQHLGGELRGGWRRAPTPPNARPLATLTSRPLAELIGGMNKYSNNFMTRQLFLTLGVEQYGPPATLDKARRAWRATLEGVGVDLRGAVVDNGAGLSRQSRLSANGLLQGLLAAYQSPHRYTFLSSLAQVGVDGTLRRRFRHEPLQGRVYGKTGTLNGVRALAGYVRATSGATLAVAILHEQPGLRRNAAVDVQNTLLRWVYHNH